jgi:hypothetical protein
MHPPPRATPTTNLHVSMVVKFAVVATRPARARVFEWRSFTSSERSVVRTVAHFFACFCAHTYVHHHHVCVTRFIEWSDEHTPAAAMARHAVVFRAVAPPPPPGGAASASSSLRGDVTVAMLPRGVVLHITRFLDAVTVVTVRCVPALVARSSVMTMCYAMAIRAS